VVAFTFMHGSLYWQISSVRFILSGLFFWPVDSAYHIVGIDGGIANKGFTMHISFDTNTIIHLIMALCYLYLAFSH